MKFSSTHALVASFLLDVCVHHLWSHDDMPLRDEIPEESPSLFSGMKGYELLAFFRAFEWKECLKSFLGNLCTDDCLTLLKNLQFALPDEL